MFDTSKMNPTANELLSTCDVLPVAEQREVAVEILRRATQWESPPLTDEEVAQLADVTFQELDRREAEDEHAGEG